MKNQLMSLFQFYSYIDGSLHVSGPQAHLRENSHSCSHNHWFSIRTVLVACSVCVNVEIRRYMNKIETVTSVGFSLLMLKRGTVQKA